MMMTAARPKELFVRSNRTFMELKYAYARIKNKDGGGSNRTFMELK